MAESLWDAARRLREILERFDPTLLSGLDNASVVQALALTTEKACAAARARAAARAIGQGAHSVAGFASGTDWLARQMGSTNGEARLAIETATAIESCPEAKQALAAGELSLAQAHEIATSQLQMADAAHDLVDLARTSSLTAVRDAIRDRTTKGSDPDQLRQCQRRQRQFRHWRDRYGMVRFAGAFTPDVGVPITNRLEAEAERLRATARRSKVDEPFSAHACDALAAMLTGSGQSGAIRSELVLVCDVNAYRRGHAHPGEVCQIVGGGPITVDQVRELSEDAFIKAVLHDGVRIDTIKHFGRYMRAELRTALEVGAPPGFEGAVCVEPECGRRYGLEWDHVNPLANHGPTSYANLQPRCWPHHREKTERDRAAGLLGPNPPPRTARRR